VFRRHLLEAVEAERGCDCRERDDVLFYTCAREPGGLQLLQTHSWLPCFAPAWRNGQSTHTAIATTSSIRTRRRRSMRPVNPHRRRGRRGGRSIASLSSYRSQHELRFAPLTRPSVYVGVEADLNVVCATVGGEIASPYLRIASHHHHHHPTELSLVSVSESSKEIVKLQQWRE